MRELDTRALSWDWASQAWTCMQITWRSCLKCTFWLSRSCMGSQILHFNKLLFYGSYVEEYEARNNLKHLAPCILISSSPDLQGISVSRSQRMIGLGGERDGLPLSLSRLLHLACARQLPWKHQAPAQMVLIPIFLVSGMWGPSYNHMVKMVIKKTGFMHSWVS